MSWYGLDQKDEREAPKRQTVDHARDDRQSSRHFDHFDPASASAAKASRSATIAA
jgi:hypothetical protein